MKGPVGFGAVHSSSQYGECAKVHFVSVLFAISSFFAIFGH